MDPPELSEVEQHILLDELGSLSEQSRSLQSQILEVIQYSGILAISSAVTGAVAGRYVPSYLSAVAAVLVVLFGLLFFFSSIRLGIVKWTDLHRAVLEKRLGAWSHHARDATEEGPFLGLDAKSRLAGLLAWPFPEDLPLHLGLWGTVSFLLCVAFSAIEAALSVLVILFETDSLGLGLLGVLTIPLWFFGLKSVFTIQAHTYGVAEREAADSIAKRRLKN